MVSVHGAKWIKLTGNTFPNRELIRQITMDYDDARKCWWVNVSAHPLMTQDGKKILGGKLKELEQKGVVCERREIRG